MAINNEQRKHFEIIVNEKFRTADYIIRQKSAMLDDEVDNKIRTKLGIDAMKSAIDAKREELANTSKVIEEQIKKMKSKLDEITGSDLPYQSTRKSAFHKEKDKMMNLYNTDLRELTKLKNDSTATVWASEDITEVLRLIKNIESEVEKQYNKLDTAAANLAKKYEIKKINGGSNGK